eukprot:6049364-Prymnesium_polylepis.2
MCTRTSTHAPNAVGLGRKVAATAVTTAATAAAAAMATEGNLPAAHTMVADCHRRMHTVPKPEPTDSRWLRHYLRT